MVSLQSLLGQQNRFSKHKIELKAPCWDRKAQSRKESLHHSKEDSPGSTPGEGFIFRHFSFVSCDMGTSLEYIEYSNIYNRI